MGTVTFTVESLEGDKKIRVYDRIKDESPFDRDVRAGAKETVNVFGIAGEGEVDIFYTCPQQSEKPFKEKHRPHNGDNVQVPGCR